jgi:hypothetical protein
VGLHDHWRWWWSTFVVGCGAGCRVKKRRLLDSTSKVSGPVVMGYFVVFFFRVIIYLFFLASGEGILYVLPRNVEIRFTAGSRSGTAALSLDGRRL